jgi:hypothetical protein
MKSRASRSITGGFIPRSIVDGGLASRFLPEGRGRSFVPAIVAATAGFRFLLTLIAIAPREYDRVGTRVRGEASESAPERL